ncbi:DUF262 domain-containing protein [Mucilaginibacter sp. KACC 22773]|uniref:DUF262 domain-containing protein n=1 Tax=Mucilaginibacter sp. KACC 22773 TaxID=3025671 RepID=UPI002365F312|nr:DUF262 domain-containing protein [Mucilaginibacter sp. KACC 22773]WDF75786.1 DUF262 domain-containing protein [Mucilaginibacter sp. KACC 22773]
MATQQPSLFSDEEVNEWLETEDDDSPSSDTVSKIVTDETISDKYSNTQLRIVRTNIDYSIDYLKNAIGTLIDLMPQYQRRSRWDITKRSLLIESLLLNIPIPPIFLFEKEYGMYEVVDGRQRLETLKDFLSGNLSLRGLKYWKELNGKKFEQLPIVIQRGILRRTISATVLLTESATTFTYEQDNGDTDVDVRMILFNRLNSGGVQLNAQELRNALYESIFNRMLKEVSRHALFTKIWGIPPLEQDEKENPSKILISNSLYKSMVDCELVLRFFAIRETNQDLITGGLKTLLDKSMRLHYTDDEAKVEQSKDLFLKTLERLNTIFDNRPFIVPNTDKPSRPLYDALMVALSFLTVEELAEPATIKSRLQTSLNDDTINAILLGKQNTVEGIKERIEEATKILKA